MTLEQAFFIQALAAYIQGKSDIRVPGGWEGLDAVCQDPESGGDLLCAVPR